MRNIPHLVALLVSLWCSALFAQTGAALPPLPALNDPATTERLPGKFIFADFFTSDIETARRFYGGLFGWEWRWMSPDHSYGMFYQDNIAVAGVVLHEAVDPKQACGRWIYYLASGDVAKKVANITGELATIIDSMKLE